MLSLFKEHQGGSRGWTRVGDMKLVTWAKASQIRQGFVGSGEAFGFYSKHS